MISGLWEDRLYVDDAVEARTAQDAALQEQLELARLLFEDDDREPWNGRRIVQLRHSLGMTQRDFAVEIGVHHSTIQWWENGKSRPATHFAERMKELEQRVAA